MGFIKKHPRKAAIVAFLAILYLLTRLLFLTRLPIFTDESIYIYWAKFIATYHSHWFISLSDGKPPLLIWTIAIFLKVLPSQAYLLAGRLPSVIAGAIGVIGVYKLAKMLFKSEKVGFIAAFLAIINPFILLYDRMALFDSMLSAMLVWSVYFAVKTAQTKKIQDAILWGIFLGLAFLAKPTAIIFVGLTPICLLLLQNKKSLFSTWKTLLLLIIIAVIIGEAINNLQRVSHVYALMAQKNEEFQEPLSQILKDPFSLTINNLRSFMGWLSGYYTMPLFIIGILGFIYTTVKRWRVGLILLLLVTSSLVTFALFGRIVFPRYILLITPYVMIAIAFLFYDLAMKKKLLYPTVMVFCAITIAPIVFDYTIITNPGYAPLPDIDYSQYVSDQSSGFGLDKIFSYLDNASKTKHITVVTQGTFGLYPYAFNLYYWGNPNVTILAEWPLKQLDNEIYQAAKKQKTFIVLKDEKQLPPQLPLQLLLQVNKPNGIAPIFLTKIRNQ